MSEQGRYGGTTTIMSTLPVGTVFYVCNGAWDGEITEKDGDKYLLVYEIEREFPLTGVNDDYTLDIEIRKNIE